MVSVGERGRYLDVGSATRERDGGVVNRTNRFLSILIQISATIQ